MIENSHVVPLAKLADFLNQIPMDEEIVTICKVGARSLDAARLLRGWGYKKVRSLKGGVEKWAEIVDPTMPRY